MKKKITIFLVLLINCIAFGQDIIKDYGQLNELALTHRDGKIRMEAEQPATFPLGADALRNMIANNFRMRKIVTTADQEFCTLIFIVGKEGTIEHVKSVGSNLIFNKEAERALLKIKQKWTPGIMNGEKIYCRFKIPLTVTFTKK